MRVSAFPRRVFRSAAMNEPNRRPKMQKPVPDNKVHVHVTPCRFVRICGFVVRLAARSES